MPNAIQIIVLPVDSGKTVETSLVAGGVAEGTLRVSGDGYDALTGVLELIRTNHAAGVAAYLALPDPTMADAYVALADKDLADAAITIQNMSSGQKAALLRYIQAINDEEDTTAIEAAIADLDEE